MGLIEADYSLAKQEECRDDVKAGEDDDHDDGRRTWSGRLDFLMSALSYAVGMGNLWRFPYLCYKNGGGAFLIPYIIMVVLAGFPIIFLEFAFGQYGRQGIVSIWKACPIFKGIGWSMFAMSSLVSVYYSMLIAWCIYYIFSSFASVVPWRGCDNAWNTADCVDLQMIRNRTALYNVSLSDVDATTTSGFVNVTASSFGAVSSALPLLPSEEFFHRRMLQLSDDFDDFGYPIWQLVLCLFFVWCVIFISLSRGIRSSGKATYVTAMLPYVVLVILFVRGMMLDGAYDGVMFYLTPQWDQLLSPQVWGDAAVQVFFSFSCCWGGLITLATYNDFHNDCLRDAIVVAVGDTLTSLFGGVVIFSFIGSLAHTMQLHVKDVATQGAGLAFIIYPQAVTTLPVSQLWAVLFMVMLASVGIGTMFALVQTVQTTLIDVFPSTLRKGRRPLMLLFAVCVTTFLCGIPLTCRGGLYLLQVMDKYVATYSVLIIGIMLCVALPWVYGLKKLFKDIEMMTGHRLGLYWIVMWKYVTPGIIVLILSFSVAGFTRSSYAGYRFPAAADVAGWLVVGVELACIPVAAAVAVRAAGGPHARSWLQRLRQATRPSDDWGPPGAACLPKPTAVEIPLQPMSTNGRYASEHTQQYS